MSGYDCRNKCVFSFRRNTVNYEAGVMSPGRLFHSYGSAKATDHSPMTAMFEPREHVTGDPDALDMQCTNFTLDISKISAYQK